MKICPTCSRKYEDDTLQFCLDDGSRLAQARDPQATWRLPDESANEPRRSVPPTTPSPPATITARPEHFQGLPQPFAPPPVYQDEPKRNNVLPWILGIVVVLGISGVLIAWIISRGSSERVAVVYPSPLPTVEVMRSPDTYRTPAPTVTTTPLPSPTVKDERKPKATPEPTAPPKKPAFSILNNTSYGGGSRITYYPRGSVGGCQADCAANASCRAFTWIRPGAYNPGDSAMCYLMYSVTGPVSHPCCISGVKN
jgi:hypothetical protein